MRYAQTYAESRSRLLVGAVLAVGAVTALYMTRSALGGDFYPLILLYVMAFMTFAWKRRTLAMAFIYVSALFPWDIGGDAAVAIGIGEVHLMFVTILMLFDFVLHRWPLPRSPIYFPVAFYLAVCVVSALYVWRGKNAAVSLVQMFLYFIVATSVFSNYLPHARQHIRVAGTIIFGGVFMAGALLASYFFHSRGDANAVYVLGMHKNAIGGALSYSIIVCLELWFSCHEPRRKGWLSLALCIILVGLILSLSRGAWLCALTGLLIIVVLRGQLGLLARSAIILIPIGALVWQLLPSASRDYAGNFDSNSVNILARLESIDFASGRFAQAPWIGVGVGLRKSYDATNVILLTAAETGILGLIGFLAIHLTFLIMVLRARRTLAPGDPRFSLLAIGAALVFGKLIHGCVDQYWSRGSCLIVWGGAGMAIAAYYSSLRTPQQSAQGGPPTS